LYVIVRDSYCRLMGIAEKYVVTTCDERAEQTAENYLTGTTVETPTGTALPATYK
jgi:hypothetical protein